ncbi:MAG: glucosamine-6-phosphate isomerase [Lentisphaeria bacterium]|nr:glucosamine-6-phosphate isomerase [Lentisphaeria bacterium]
MNACEPTPRRRQEIRELLGLDPERVRQRARERLHVSGDVDGIYRALADAMAAEVRNGNREGRPTRLILPVGPVGQYPLFLDTIRAEKLSLGRCWLFFMDEYADDDGGALSEEHPLSFAGEMLGGWLHDLPESLRPPPRQIVFPGPDNIALLAERMRALGGIDACFGGIGIHGHLAFNEPENGVAESDPRRVRLNDFTVTINAVRSPIGGNLEAFPRYAYTLGMRQILGARRLRLACRNTNGLDWAKTVLRLTLFGRPGDDYPCTCATRHADLVVYTDEDTLRCPDIVIPG